MVRNPFVVIFSGVLICTIHIICGRKIVGKEKTSLEHFESTSKIGCSTRDMECGVEHEYNIQKILQGKHGVMYGRGIGQSYTGKKNMEVYVSDINFCMGYCNMISNNTTNIDSNNGSNNVIGSGSNNGNINGSSNTNGTANIPGSGNNDPIIVSIGQNNGNGNDNVNPGSG